MQLSIIITTKNRYKDLIDCVNSVLKSQILNIITWELIIIDDKSTDKTKKMNSFFFKKNNIHILHLKSNAMMVKARNIGAKRARGEYVLFIDDDNIIDKNMIEILIEKAKKNKEFGIIGPSMYYLDSKKKYLSFQKINFFTGRTKGYLNNEDANTSDGIPNVFMIKKEVFAKYGYFDEEIIQTFTEADISFKIKFDYKSIIVNSAITWHKVSEKSNYNPRGLGGEFKQKAYCLIRNRTIIICRYAQPFQKFIYIILFSWFWPAAYSLMMLRFKRLDLIKLYWYGFKDGIVYFLSGKIYNSLNNK